ncbi:hypothetical protein JCM19037_1628 [Geomicrobium sp. JCM 19037]|uniref:hypothetical protein n=1 Tax=Geomicrobium sp. JCM 19037 TaxID=1460634 RepID=UPI00045F12C5|nr:hypothetical protein [Geomicrobium sp. JCM 19037]GAK03313.1 hypothetical protein JCM19037_1628 [Geomicrobium sp. JCM 19037]
MTLSEEQLNAIKERAYTASESPWLIDGTDIWVDGNSRIDMKDYGSILQSFADAEFIAHTREDIPALLTHIVALENCSQELRNETKQQRRIIEDLSKSKRDDLADLPGYYPLGCF